MSALIQVAPVGASAAESGALTLLVTARHPRADGSIAEFTVDDGSVLRSGDGVQISFASRRDVYVYVFMIGSSGRAALLFPGPQGGQGRGVRVNRTYSIPRRDDFFMLDDKTGDEAVFAFSSPTPVRNIQSVLARVEGFAADHQGILRDLRHNYGSGQKVSFRHIAGAPLFGVDMFALDLVEPAPVDLPRPASATAEAGTTSLRGLTPASTFGDRIRSRRNNAEPPADTVVAGSLAPGPGLPVEESEGQVLSGSGSLISAYLGRENRAGGGETAPEGSTAGSQKTAPEASVPDPERERKRAETGAAFSLGSLFSGPRVAAEDTPQGAPPSAPAPEAGAPREAERLAAQETQRERLALLEEARAQAEREAAARERLAREAAARDEARRARLARVEAEKEQAARETAVREELAREQAERERLAELKAEQERASREQAALTNAAREQAEAERRALVEAARKQAEREAAARKRLAREQAERERLSHLKAQQESAEREAEARERLAREQVEQQRLARLQAEREQALRAQIAREEARNQARIPEVAGAQKPQARAESERAAAAQELVARVRAREAAERERQVAAQQARERAMARAEQVVRDEVTPVADAEGYTAPPEGGTESDVAPEPGDRDAPSGGSIFSRLLGFVKGTGSAEGDAAAADESRPEPEPDVQVSALDRAGLGSTTIELRPKPALPETTPGASPTERVREMQAAVERRAAAAPPAVGAAAPAAPAPVAGPDLSALTQLPVPAPSIGPEIGAGVVLVVTPTGMGSGILLSQDGEVLTNWHLVQDYPYLSVMLAQSDGIRTDQENVYTARVVKANKLSDLALIRIDSPPRGLRPLRFATAEGTALGEVVYALGHGETGSLEATGGRVLRKRPNQLWYAGHNVIHRSHVIQVRGTPEPPSEGGPLLNEDYEVVGINAFGGRGKPLFHAVSMETIKAFLRGGPDSTAGLP